MPTSQKLVCIPWDPVTFLSPNAAPGLLLWEVALTAPLVMSVGPRAPRAMKLSGGQLSLVFANLILP